MKLPLDITEDCAFAIVCRYEARVYVKNLGRGGGALPSYKRYRSVSPTITAHYHKEGWTNILPNTSSKVKAIGIIVIYEKTD